MARLRKLIIKMVVKNDGTEQPFEWGKVERSVVAAGKDTKAFGKKEAKGILRTVRERLSKVKKERISTQEIRDVVEPAMAEAGYFKTARYYILYRERKEQAQKKQVKLVEPEMSEVGMEIAKKRYLRTDMEGKVIESPGELFWRVAQHMAKAEIQWSGNGEVKDMAKQFYERLVNWKFLPTGKAMFEAGNPGGSGQMSACFVLPIEDSVQSIFKTLGDAAVVHKNNGGTGFNFSRIRPHGDKVKNVPGAASGPVDFLRAYSATLAQILQGAKRQGANIAILNVDHPDVEEFIHLKDEDGTIKNFNISVGVTNEFLEAVERDEMWKLRNPRNGEVWKRMKARELFDLITEHAWVSGDPGLAFLDRMEEDNPTPAIGKIDATNPCGEIPLLPYESCNLTSICLHKHLTKKAKSKKQRSKINEGEYEIDWEDLEKSVRLGIRFLDNMIEVNTYAIPEIEQMVKHGNRRIGLGVMGFAHMLYLLGIPYNSQEAVRLASRLAKFIHKTAEAESLELAKVRGTFPNWDVSIYAGSAEKYRNCALTMIAPTGTISLLANTSSGIEPVFSLVTLRKAFNEDDKKNRPTREFMMVDKVFEDALQKQLRAKSYKLKANGKILEDLDAVLAVAAEQGLKAVEGLPGWFYKVFVTTHEIAPTWHVKIQAAWQKWFDNSISKTINFRHEATVGEVKKAYLLAWKLGCKGITIYRDGSKQDQVLNLAKEKVKEKRVEVPIGEVGKQESKVRTGERVDAEGVKGELGNTNGTIHGETGRRQKLAGQGNGSLNGHVSKAVEVGGAEQLRMEPAVMRAVRPGAGETTVCPECGAGVVYESGCVTCQDCGWSECSL